MSTQIGTALIGVIGTLAGTVLGWLLTSLSQSGKINIYISSFTEYFEYNERGTMVASTSIDQTHSYSYKLRLDIYNSSGATRIMRNMTVVFSDGKKELLRSIPMDDSTARSQGFSHFYDEVASVNIPPKTVVQMNVHDGAWKDNGGLDFLWKTKKVYLTYMDEKNRTKKVQIKSEAYRDHFANQKLEDEMNVL